MNRFNMTDRPVDRPTCTAITVEHVPDEYPDLSWLDQGDEDMGEGFEATSQARKASYGTEWSMIGIRATATVLVPLDGATCIQTVVSPGLWSVEDDSAPEYLTEIEDEQVDDVRTLLDALGIDHADAEVQR